MFITLALVDTVLIVVMSIFTGIYASKFDPEDDNNNLDILLGILVVLLIVLLSLLYAATMQLR